MRITLRQIEHFTAVVEEQSITKAAARLRVSPGGISLSLSQFEEALGVQLLLRKPGRGVAVTPNGRWVYQQAKQVHESIDEIQQTAQIMRGALAGPLRIGCYLTLSPWLLPGLTAHFAEHHPGVALHFEEGGSEELQERLSSGELDTVLLYENHLRHGFDSEPVMQMQLQLAIAPTHRLAALETVPLEELVEEDAILLDMQPSLARIEDIFANVGLRPRIRWRSRNIETIRSMVARGLGYAILMGRPYGDSTYEGLPLVYRAIRNPIPLNTVVLATPSGARPSAKVEALTQFFRAEPQITSPTASA